MRALRSALGEHRMKIVLIILLIAYLVLLIGYDADLLSRSRLKKLGNSQQAPMM
jgi:hypothetical protein